MFILFASKMTNAMLHRTQEKAYMKSNLLMYKKSLEKYHIIFDDSGNSISEYEDKMINFYKSTSELRQGVFCYIKNTKTKTISLPYDTNIIDQR